MSYLGDILSSTAVSSEAWAKLRDWASVAGRGRLLLSGSVAHGSLKTAVSSFGCSCSFFSSLFFSLLVLYSFIRHSMMATIIDSRVVKMNR